MSLFAIPFPVIDPVAFEIGPFAVRWYGLAYMAGLTLGWLYIRQLLKTERLWPAGPPMPPHKADDLLLWMVIGVVIGGRLGFVLLYDPGYFLKHPAEIFAIWQGGMAFHGGLIGSILVLCVFAWRNHVSALTMLDLAAAAVPIGLFFGRIANFINVEVYGRVSDVPWAIVFPGAGPDPRHPSQLYEAFAEGILLFLVLRYMTHSRNALARPGLVGATFMIGYGLARIVVENFRELDPYVAPIGGFLTAGQAYSIPMVLIGVYFVWRAYRRPAIGQQTGST